MTKYVLSYYYALTGTKIVHYSETAKLLPHYFSSGHEKAPLL